MEDLFPYLLNPTLQMMDMHSNRNKDEHIRYQQSCLKQYPSQHRANMEPFHENLHIRSISDKQKEIIYWKLIVRYNFTKYAVYLEQQPINLHFPSTVSHGRKDGLTLRIKIQFCYHKNYDCMSRQTKNTMKYFAASIKGRCLKDDTGLGDCNK